MKSAGVAELKAKLSGYLEQVKAGDEVIVTEHGVPVAKLVGLSADDRKGSRRTRLAVAGTLKLGRGKARRALLAPPSDELPGDGVLAALLAEREDGR